MTKTLVSPPSDQQKLETLFTERGIGFTKDAAGSEVTCTKGSPKVGGYNGFHAVFKFEPTGRFVNMSVWE